jgi:hypothetical protein
LIHEARHLIQALGFYRSTRGEAETDAVENDGDLGGERFESADLAARRVEKIIGDHLQEVEAIEVLENTGG